MAENIFNWQFNTLPGNANQGAILMTRNDIQRPPFTQDDFIWKAMEDVIGTADVKLEYDQEVNRYTIYKAKGHLDNNNQWTYTWEAFGSWEPITEEVAEALRQLKYISYRYDTSVANTLTVYGVKKDMTEDLMVSISFVSQQEFTNTVNTLTNSINNEITRATNRENEINTRLTNEITRATNREDELEDLIEHNQAISGNATTVTQSSSGRIVNVNVDNDSIKITSNQLKADVFDDTQVRKDKGWSSAKISQEMTSAMHYKGQVATYANLPTSGQQVGDCYNVLDTGDNYAWNGTGWDKLSGEYIAGEGISIDGKVISSTGISFAIGDGLESSGSGSTQTLFTKNGLGLEYDSNRANKVKAGTGVTVNSAGVNVNTGNTTQIVSNKMEVKPYRGVQNTANGLSAKVTNGCMLNANGIGINANWTVKSTPLNTKPSKLAIYSDGKIAVDFEESPVILSGELLATGNFAIGSNVITSLSVPELNNYDMIAIETNLSTVYYPKGIASVRQSTMVPDSIGNAGQAPKGLTCYMTLIRGVDWTNNRMTNIENWYKATMGSGDWSALNASSGSPYYIKVYGMKAR